MASAFDEDEVARQGEMLYRQSVEPHINPSDFGMFVAIDILSGEYQINEDDFEAVEQLKSRRPTAEIWLMRVGQPTAYVMRRSS